MTAWGASGFDLADRSARTAPRRAPRRARTVHSYSEADPKRTLNVLLTTEGGISLKVSPKGGL